MGLSAGSLVLKTVTLSSAGLTLASISNSYRKNECPVSSVENVRWSLSPRLHRITDGSLPYRKFLIWIYRSVGALTNNWEIKAAIIPKTTMTDILKKNLLAFFMISIIPARLKNDQNECLNYMINNNINILKIRYNYCDLNSFGTNRFFWSGCYPGFF